MVPSERHLPGQFDVPGTNAEVIQEATELRAILAKSVATVRGKSKPGEGKVRKMPLVLGRKMQESGAILCFLFVIGGTVAPTFAHAADFSGSGFESRMENLQGKFINVLLPLVNILGLVYAGILAASGNEGPKARSW